MLLFPAVLRCLPLSVDFSRSGIWGKLGTGVQGICLKSCAKFPPKSHYVSLALHSDPSPLTLTLTLSAF